MTLVAAALSRAAAPTWSRRSPAPATSTRSRSRWRRSRAGRRAARTAALAILIAVLSNTLVKCGISAVLGGPRLRRSALLLTGRARRDRSRRVRRALKRRQAAMALLGLAFFLSGAAALVYQVVWQRILTLHTGVGVVSMALIVASFMAGLGIGSELGGLLSSRLRAAAALRGFALHRARGGAVRRAELPAVSRRPRPLRGLAVRDHGRRGARAFPRVPAADDAHGDVAAVPGEGHGSRGGFGLARDRCALRAERAGRGDGRARSRRGCSCATSGWRAPCAWAPSPTCSPPSRRSWPGAVERPPASARQRPPSRARRSRPARRARCGSGSLLYGVSGFIALSFEIAWFRLMDVAVKSTAYTFGTVLALYLLGLGAGSLVGGRASPPRLARPLEAFLDLQLLLLASAGLALALLARLPPELPVYRLLLRLLAGRGLLPPGGGLGLDRRSPGSTACCRSRSSGCRRSSWGSRSARCSARSRTTRARAAARSGLLQAANIVGCTAGQPGDRARAARASSAPPAASACCRSRAAACSCSSARVPPA